MKKKSGFDRKTVIALIVALAVLAVAWGVRSHLRREADVSLRMVGETFACTDEDILKDRSVDKQCACEAKDLGATVKRLTEEFGHRDGAALAEIRVSGLSRPLYFWMGENGYLFLFVPLNICCDASGELVNNGYGRFHVPTKADIKMSEPGAKDSYRIDIEANICGSDGHTTHSEQSFTNGGSGGTE